MIVVRWVNLGLFRKKEEYEKGGVVRGSIQTTKGFLEHSRGSVLRASGDRSGIELQRRGAQDVTDGLKKMVGIKVKKK